ncbi:protein O-glucosyltransferase 1-like isoform X1 [Cucurbita pepo subsp. pepo]|uniref:protein O-glucosyltransferase 1-like isoform X1 n=1 Tax=Cucurbita pepo subsp. pepo TaxID=3664 RepID=UPI000C9D3615|nr:protein O-glucosyltransferase 1-like isoform X1 [Cucurbita pepo subsp. pepo]
MRDSSFRQRLAPWNSPNFSFSDHRLFKPFLKSPAAFSLIFLVAGAFLSTLILYSPWTAWNLSGNIIKGSAKFHSYPDSSSEIPKRPHRQRQVDFPLDCTSFNNVTSGACPATYPTIWTVEEDPNLPPSSTCPEYFRWIHEDLRPWAQTGITRASLEAAKQTANFRLVIVNGTAYVETYEKSFQTRDTFTLWGILQLLRRYPGKVPDLEMMFDCVDWPVILTTNFSDPNGPAPPPLFRYCGNDATLDVVFPDWSFWGWSEINIKPWEVLLKDLKEGNKRTPWKNREAYAYWKGNPEVAETRKDLLKCNVSDQQDWNARVFAQDWMKESQQGYKESDLANQCLHRYKIYIEGSAWSVSEKYILACDSVALIVKPHYYDFFTRGLMPLHHYWPVKDDDKCKSIKFAVDWGNSHKQKAKTIGKAASSFIQEELKMDYVYDYMFHLLSEYSKLLTFKPTIPSNAIELCSEAMACPAEGLTKKFMMESLVKSPADSKPCAMPPPYDPASLHLVLRRKEDSIKQVEEWENTFWDAQSRQP